MAQPTAYTPATDFSDEELDNVSGRSTVRTAAVDAEFAAIETTLDGVLTNLSLNHRDDGEIRDARVKLHTLDNSVLALFSATAGTPRGAWLTATAYVVRDVVTQGTNTYICCVAHTSGTFAVDLAAVKWLLVTLGTAPSASGIPFTPTATIAATNAQTAIDESDTENRAASAAALALATANDLAVRADLASVAALAKGAGMSGFDYALNYVLGTTGWAIKQGAINLAWMTGYDPTGVADSSVAVTAAIALLPSTGGTIYVPGICKLASTIVVNKPCVFFGQGAGQGGISVGFVTSNQTLDMFQVTSQGVTFVDLTFMASVVRTNGYFINFTSINNCCRVERCVLSQYFNGIGVTGGASLSIRILNCYLNTTIASGSAINYSGSANSVDLVVRDTFISGSGNQGGIQLVTIGDILLDHVSTLFCSVGLSITPAAGQVCQVVMVDNCLFDTGTSYGVLINPAAGGIVNLVKCMNTWSCSNAYGMSLNPSGTGQTKRVEVVNCTLSSNTNAGLHIGGSTVTNTLVQGGSMAANANGIFVVGGTTKFQIDNVRCGTNGQFGPNTSYGINLAAGATDDFSITNCDLQANTTAGLLDGASGVARSIVNNRGFVTKSSGSNNVAIAAASRVVTHGLAGTPVAEDIIITDTSSRAASSINSVWLSAIGATTFQVNTNANVAAAAFNFSWRASCKGA